jgi:hypothetical protein
MCEYLVFVFYSREIIYKKKKICYSRRRRRYNAGRAFNRDSGSCFQQSSMIVNTSESFY